jgi:L-lactate dehydrogenase complex protein LldG
MSTSAREDILGRLRAKLGRTADNGATASRHIDAALAARQQGPRPRVDGDLLARFKQKSESLATTVDIVAEWQSVPLAVARYLSAQQLPTQVVGWPLVAGHAWREAGIEFAARGAVDADLVGVTGCFCAIAETGTLMLLSGPATPGSVSLLPETHIAIVAVSRLVPGMEEAWNLARTERGELPRAVNFISGPSRTGDIEQTIVLGAHGPYRVHVVVVTGA